MDETIKTKTVVIPNDVIDRMSTVNDESNLVTDFYPRIARASGTDKNAYGINMVLLLAIHDFATQYPPIVGGILMLEVPRWIDALIDDKEVAAAALEIFEESRSTSKKK